MKENCRTCEHFIPDAKAPRRGLCNAVLSLGAKKRGNFRFETHNPRVRRDRNGCIANFGIRVLRSRDIRGRREYEWIQAYKPLSPLRRFIRSVADRFNS